jgi:hypothetical protein
MGISYWDTRRFGRKLCRRRVVLKETQSLRSEEHDRIGHDGSTDHEREDRVVGLENTIRQRSVVDPTGNRVKKEDSTEHARRVDPRHEKWQDVKEGGVDQHERREREGKPRLPPPDFRGTHPEHDYEGVRHVKGIPFDRELKHPPRPVPPVVLILFKDMQRIRGNREPQKIVVGHGGDQLFENASWAART